MSFRARAHRCKMQWKNGELPDDLNARELYRRRWLAPASGVGRKESKRQGWRQNNCLRPLRKHESRTSKSRLYHQSRLRHGREDMRMPFARRASLRSAKRERFRELSFRRSVGKCFSAPIDRRRLITEIAIQTGGSRQCFLHTSRLLARVLAHINMARRHISARSLPFTKPVTT